MDKADIAIAIAVLSAAFTGWQAWSGHVSARAAKQALARKKPVFEISTLPVMGFDDWTAVSVTGRNTERVSVVIKTITSRNAGILLLRSEDTFVPQTDPRVAPKREYSKRKASHTIYAHQMIGPVGEGSATLHFTIYAHGIFDKRKLAFEWEWADGAKS